MTKRCFLCGSKMDENTGLCTNTSCVRSQPLPDPKKRQKMKRRMVKNNAIIDSMAEAGKEDEGKQSEEKGA